MRTLIAVAIWAAGTFALTLAFLLPAGVTATGPQDQVAATIAKPKLTVNGCQLSVRAVGLHNAPANTLPALELVATNPGKEAADVEWAVTLSATPPASLFSRREPMSQPIWKDKGTIALKAGETKTIALGKVVPTTRPIADGEFVPVLRELAAAPVPPNNDAPTTQPKIQANPVALSASRYTITLASGTQAIQPIYFSLNYADGNSRVAQVAITK